MISPNPVTQNTIIRFNAKNSDKIVLLLLSPEMRIIRRLSFSNITGGTNTIQWSDLIENKHTLKQDIYFILIRSGNTIQAQKVLVL